MLFYVEPAARLERKSFFAYSQVLFNEKLSAKKIGSGRRISCPTNSNQPEKPDKADAFSRNSLNVCKPNLTALVRLLRILDC